MADAVLGQAWIDVSLRPKNVEKDAEKVANTAGKKIEAFFDKYSKESFFDKYSRKAEESKLSVFLPSDKALGDAAKGKMSLVNRIMSSMGAKINQTGMMGAQLSYAAQDFVTGLSMGNLNQALMGASNNIGMMFQQISPLAGALSTLALVSIPLSIAAMKLFGTETQNSEEAIKRLTVAMEMHGRTMKLNAIARQAMTDAEVKRMHGAGNLQSKIDAERKGMDDINDQIKEQQAARGKLADIMQGFEIFKTIPKNDPALQQILKLHIGPANVLRGGEKEEILKQHGLPAGATRTHDVIVNKQTGDVEIRRRVKQDEKDQAAKDLGKVQETERNLEGSRKNHILNLQKLQKQREVEAREELEFRQREAGAGFSKYELGKIHLDREQRDLRRKREEAGFGNVIIKPAMTDEEHAKRQEEISARAKEAQESLQKEMTDLRDNQRRHGRVLTDKEVRAFSDRKDAIEQGRKNAVTATEQEWLAGKPVTLLDAMNAADKKIFANKRLELAQQFAGGGPVGFAGISDLYKQIQGGVGTKGNSTEQQIEAHTKDTMLAIQDLSTWIKTHPPQAPAWGN